MKELYSVSVVVLADKLALASAGCKIVEVVMMAIRIAITTTGPVLTIQYCPVLHDRNLLIIIVLTPAPVFQLQSIRHILSLKNIMFLFYWPGYSNQHHLFMLANTL